jgi:protein pelota
MKAEELEINKGYGEIRLFPESLDDLWHLKHLIAPRDLVFATTFRAVDSATDKIRPEKMEKRPVRLGIRVGKVEFHPSANRLRVMGVIEHGVDAGSYHTINVEPGFEISVIKFWRQVDRDRIDRAVKASIFDLIHILTIEEGEAELFRIRQYGPESVITITMGSGKEGDTNNRITFFERLVEQVREIRGPLIVAGPGFVKDDFLKFLAGKRSGIAQRALPVETRRIGYGAAQEVIGLGVTGKLIGDMQLAHEVRLMEEIIKRISQEGAVAYGRNEVIRAIEYGAVEQLLVVDALLHDYGVSRLMERAERTGAKIVVLSGEFEPGERLVGLGGVAALLRFRVG